MDFDVIVLGAGIVGVSTAVHLQDRAQRVALVDRRAPGEETSFGNAGLIERSSIVPYGFPRSFGTLLRYARNRSTDLYWDYKALPSYAGWLMRYWWESAPGRHAAAAHDMLPLISACIAEHDALIARAGAADLVHDGGWIEAYRTQAALDKKRAAAETAAREHGLHVETLDATALHAREPGIGESLCGGLHWRDPKSVRSPGALVKSYARLFESIGGVTINGDAATLRAESGAWTVQTESGRVSARDVVIALGPWSDIVFGPLGYRIPLRVKRGYHMHYRPTRTPLSVPVIDIERGYVVAPMEDNRLRVTTGAELAMRDTPPTGIQLARVEPLARAAFGIGERLDAQPWLGMRPCTPDMRPVIGPAPRHSGLWFAFGHNHHGLTLGPVTGRLLAEMITGATPFTDPRPYRAERFN
ncbi:NAD(P)/FAD-dependent oxidoreductase [Paraburkholderia rhizosphaerae]|uniref:D-amino-acid dehydrogenase n=1 Tax=Paraburkholderia rhizosphaerae TaxID=480658 RepID=A0A4R8M341_9BURK|nr:FAD-binding oxidoreductase [Paraburkholderia rhizosphaerae]TDY54205.1 D-amino-acid dehydrogenase [Paraburkholderia rhizosphaerae]